MLLKVSSLLLWKLTNLEIVRVEFKILYLKFALCVCYRPPSYGRDFVEKLGASLEEVFFTYPEHIIILAGDFIHVATL